jgi:hypothetical protein
MKGKGTVVMITSERNNEGILVLVAITAQEPPCRYFGERYHVDGGIGQWGRGEGGRRGLTILLDMIMPKGSGAKRSWNRKMAPVIMITAFATVEMPGTP